MHGKAILYARQTGETTPAFAAWCWEQNESRDWPALADLPRAGTRIEAGQPLLTLFATGGSLSQVRTELRRKASQVFHRASHRF
jgi:predicted ATP-grasp superfamily ATP-dependent carboligase